MDLKTRLNIIKSVQPRYRKAFKRERGIILTEGVLGEQTGTGTGGPIIEASPSPSPEILGEEESGNVGIGSISKQQTQRFLLGILAGLAILFALNLYYRRAS